MQPLMDAGLDSLGAVELRTTLASRFAMDLPATLTFDYPTVRALSQYLVENLTPVMQVRQVIPFPFLDPALPCEISCGAVNQKWLQNVALRSERNLKRPAGPILK